MSGDTQAGRSAPAQAKADRDLANARRDAAKWRRRYAQLRAGLVKLLDDERSEEPQEEREERIG